MNTKLVEHIANAVLYEGYMLYPYRASAVKNRQRWNFGVLYPRAFSESQKGNDAWTMQTECLVQTAGELAELSVRVRFLHLLERSTEGQSAQPWQEGTERDVLVPPLSLSELPSNCVRRSFTFAATSEKDGIVLRKWEQIEGAIEVKTDDLGQGLFKIRARVFNTASLDDPTHTNRDRALMRSLVSAHTILSVEGGEFISLLDPPDETARCGGTMPKRGNLAGTRRRTRTARCHAFVADHSLRLPPNRTGKCRRFVRRHRD